MVEGDQLKLDHRYFQSLLRRSSDDSRGQIVRGVRKTLRVCCEILRSYHHSEYATLSLDCMAAGPSMSCEQLEIVEEMLGHASTVRNMEDMVVQGLQNLATFRRYAQDSGFQIELESLTKQFQKLCSRASSLCRRLEQLKRREPTKREAFPALSRSSPIDISTKSPRISPSSESAR
jgi:hypothetical protein